MRGPKPRSFLLSLFLSVLTSSCSTASVPTDREIDELVRTGLAFPEIYDIVEVRKTNGFQKQHNIYIADIEYDIQFKKGLFEAQKLLAREMERQHPLAGLMGSIFSAPALLLEFGQFDAGDRVTRAAKITFINTEKGWRIDQVQPVAGRPMENAPPGNPVRLTADEAKALDQGLSEAFDGNPPKWHTLAALCQTAVIRGHCGPGPQDKDWSFQAWYAHLEKRLHPKLDRVLFWQKERVSMVSFVDRAGKLRLLFSVPSERHKEVRIVLNSGSRTRELHPEQVDHQVHILDDDIGLVFDFNIAPGGPPHFTVDTGRANTEYEKRLIDIDADDAFKQRRKFFTVAGVLRDQVRHPPAKTGDDLIEEQKLIAQQAERDQAYTKLRPIYEKYRTAIVGALAKHGLCGFGTGRRARDIDCRKQNDDPLQRGGRLAIWVESTARRPSATPGLDLPRTGASFHFWHSYPNANQLDIVSFIHPSERTGPTYENMEPAMWSFIQDYFAIFGIGENLLRECAAGTRLNREIGPFRFSCSPRMQEIKLSASW